jgi:hypothetical protein
MEPLASDGNHPEPATVRVAIDDKQSKYSGHRAGDLGLLVLAEELASLLHTMGRSRPRTRSPHHPLVRHRSRPGGADGRRNRRRVLEEAN